MAASFFFYDLETSGLNPRDARIMQFAGQRTDMELNPIGEPVNVLIKLTPDIVPEPDAIMVTGITPQSTIADGVTEAEFLKIFYDEVVQPGTIFLGFNTVRFDDEFMRYLHYRNFYDAYEWQWCDECSRWDLLDVIRMTRALRPEGIEWPFYADGKPTNRLELLTKLNGIEHEQAHDAMSDVTASIAVARLIRDKQKGLFDYLLDCRGKKKCKEHLNSFVQGKQPFLYTSGRYSVEYTHTTAVKLLAHHVGQAYGYVYDLRADPAQFMDMSVDELVKCYEFSRDPEHVKLPVKIMRYNRCPAIAPIGILSDTSVQDRLKLPLATVQKHVNALSGQTDFVARVIEAIERVEAARPYHHSDVPVGDVQAVDGQLYDGDFFSKPDKDAMSAIRRADTAAAFTDLHVELRDKRLQALLPLYKARNFPQLLGPDERQAWDEFCKQRLIDGAQKSRLAKYFQRIDELARQDGLTENQRYALEELHLYGESIMPIMDTDQDASP
ncbi:MAG TPA: exodeoxyribonuclease I [Candidatus Saccharimonadales bacterium]|jgi:exodeoxyribonuclease-1